MEDWINNALKEAGFMGNEPVKVERFRDVLKRYEEESHKYIRVTEGELLAALDHDDLCIEALCESISESWSLFNKDVRFDKIPDIKRMVNGMFLALDAVANREATTSLSMRSILSSVPDHDDTTERII